MKKLFIVLLSALFIFGIAYQVRAEQSSSSASGTNYYDNQVYTIGYNNSGADISSNSLVVIDTTGTAGSTLGAYITTTTTQGHNFVFGVTDEVIADGTSGRICIRGPHKVLVNTAPSIAGATMISSTVAGKADGGQALLNVATAQPNGIYTADGPATIGRVMSVTATTADLYTPALYWIYVQQQ